MKTPHPHANLLRAIADGEQMQDTNHSNGWAPCTHNRALYLIQNCCVSNLRIAPRTIRIGNYDVPEPMRVAPEKGTQYWAIGATGALKYVWTDGRYDEECLKTGHCHLAKEAAELHRRANIELAGGTV